MLYGRAIDETLERLDILVALRRASETVPPGMPGLSQAQAGVLIMFAEKRNKRPRGQSPGTVTPIVADGNPAALTRGVSITVPPRNSVGPPGRIPYSRDPRARREALSKQLPLTRGRKVAFHPPTNTSKAADAANGGKDEEWILAVVTKSINQDKNRYATPWIVNCNGLPCTERYEVQDAEPQEDGSPGMYVLSPSRRWMA